MTRIYLHSYLEDHIVANEKVPLRIKGKLFETDAIDLRDKDPNIPQIVSAYVALRSNEELSKRNIELEKQNNRLQILLVVFAAAAVVAPTLLALIKL